MEKCEFSGGETCVILLHSVEENILNYILFYSIEFCWYSSGRLSRRSSSPETHKFIVVCIACLLIDICHFRGVQVAQS